MVTTESETVYRKKRQWHYDFAHKALPHSLFGQPEFFLSMLDDAAKSRALLSAAMARVEERGGLSAQECDAIADSIRIHRHLYANGERTARIFVLGLPEPIAATECHFVAIAYAPDGKAHYFTLEYAAGEPAATMLGAWDAEQSHHNLGDGPPADVDSFVEAVGRKLCVDDA